MIHRRVGPQLLCFLCILSVLSVSSIRLPGLGEDKLTHGSASGLIRGFSSVKIDPTRVTQLSWRPRAFLYKGFLSEKECDHLINLAKGKLEKSMVADNDSGKSIASEVRTSSGMFLNRAQDEIVYDIELRIAAWTFLPIENGESMQVLHYENGQKYEPHFDFFHDKANQIFGGHRVATVLMYLSNVEKGGETIFPNSEAKLSQPKDESWSECAHKGYAGMLKDMCKELKLMATMPKLLGWHIHWELMVYFCRRLEGTQVIFGAFGTQTYGQWESSATLNDGCI